MRDREYGYSHHFLPYLTPILLSTPQTLGKLFVLQAMARLYSHTSGSMEVCGVQPYHLSPPDLKSPHVPGVVLMACRQSDAAFFSRLWRDPAE